jgi:hypothetical protein
LKQGKEVRDPHDYVQKSKSPVILGKQHMKRMTLKDSQEVWLRRTKVSDPVISEDNTNKEEVQVVPEPSNPAPELVREELLHLPTLEDLLPEINEEEELNVLQQILGDEEIQLLEEFEPTEELEHLPQKTPTPKC